MSVLKACLLLLLLVSADIVVYVGLDGIFSTFFDVISNTDSQVLYTNAIGVISRLIAFGLIFSFFFRGHFHFRRVVGKLRFIELRPVAYLCLIAFGLELFDRPFFDLANLVSVASEGDTNLVSIGDTPNGYYIIRAISVLLIAPIGEELFFRKFLFSGLLKKYQMSFSMIFSSICFSLIHLPSYRNLLPSFIFGMVSCFIYSKTKNLIYTIVLHFIANLSWLLLSMYGAEYYNWSFELDYNLMYWLLFALGGLMTYIGVKRIQMLF